MKIESLLSKISDNTKIRVYSITHPCLYPHRNVNRLYSSRRNVPDEILSMDVKEYWIERMDNEHDNIPVLAIQTKQYYC